MNYLNNPKKMEIQFNCFSQTLQYHYSIEILDSKVKIISQDKKE